MSEDINISGVEDSLIQKPTLRKSSRGSLNGKNIAISVSINDDLERLGLSQQHVFDMSVETARYIIANGGTAMYGGDLRKDGFTEYFSELSNQYRLVNDRSYRFINYFPFPNSKEINTEVLVEFKAKQIKPLVLPLPPHLKNIDIKKEYKPMSDVEDRYVYCECFKDMREKMATDSLARIALGGKVAGFMGYLPGVIEECLYHIQSEKPVFLIGGFGGATAALIDVIKGKQHPSLNNDTQYNSTFMKSFASFVEKKYPLSDYNKLNTTLAGITVEKLASINHLSVEENEVLFTSKNIHQILYLIMKGLKNV